MEEASVLGDETVWWCSQVFHTRSLLCPSEDEPPVFTTLPVGLTSRACWAPDEAARLVVMHRNDNGLQLVVTTYELRAKQSRHAVDVLGKAPVSGPVGLRVTSIAGMLQAQSPHVSSGYFSFLSVNAVTQQRFPGL